MQVEFSPSIISYEKLLEVFWQSHDPTQLNRQGPDEGTQYRSVIFYHSPKQKKIALKSKEEVQKHYKKTVVTEIKPAGMFYRAEEYHQLYLKKRGLPACPV